jgi:F-type H+-transporting ATPase subunit delta
MLPKIEGFADALLGRIDSDTLSATCADLAAVASAILDHRDLSTVLSDTSIAHVSRGQVLFDVLEGKVGATALRLCVYAATAAPAPEVSHAIEELSFVARELLETGEFHHPNLGLLEARRRVSGYADALLDEIDTDQYHSVEDDLFRWSATVEGNTELRRVLVDRDAPLGARLGLTDQLLHGKVHSVSLALARFTIVGGRPRDVVGTLRYLVDYVALARDWRVARVHTARPLDDVSRDELASSLHAITGKPVEIQIAEDPTLLSGVLIHLGDLRLDASIRGRLGSLRDVVTSGRGLVATLNRND